jgi:hypothetical protein
MKEEGINKILAKIKAKGSKKQARTGREYSKTWGIHLIEISVITY